MSNKVLVTGGTGYIGSHTVVELINSGYEPIVVDNLSNSSEKTLDRVKLITDIRPKFYKVDCTNEEELEKVFKENDFGYVIHFAGLKAVGESVVKPLEYYKNNIDSTLVLLKLMKKYNVHNIIFSSSATVYGDPKSVPVFEDAEVKHATNPYGETKIIIERIITDFVKANPDFKGILLRYANPVGAHESGLLGESPHGIPNNLMPYIAQVAVGKLDHLNVFGDDYDTPDGTGVRDYIHVVDLAKGHVCAIKKFDDDKLTCDAINLGTGRGTSVLELVKAFEEANEIKIPYVIAPRRGGDIATNYLSAEKANKELGWKAELSVKDACKSSWNFQSKNKNGIE